MNWIYNSYLEARSIIAASDLLYPVMINIIGSVRPRQKELIANASSEIVIDGFQRSANTYFETYFEVAQKRPVIMAHHLHESYQIRYAELHNIPAIVLIREPLDAVVSALLRDPRAHVASLLRNYIRFYSNVFKHHRKAILAPFDVVVTSEKRIIDLVNATYKTEYIALDVEELHLVISKVNEKDMAAFNTDTLDLTRIASPSIAKKDAAEILKLQIREKYQALLSHAQYLYGEGLERSTVETNK